MHIVEYADEDLKDSLLVVGFPGRGLVGPIVSAYVIEELAMTPVAGLLSAEFPPTVSVRDGVASPPVQFFVSQESCGPDGRCDKLLVLNAEIPIEPSQAHAMAEAVLDWAKQRGVRCVVTVEGVELEDEEGEPMDGRPIYGAAGPNTELTLEAFGVSSLPDGVITSHSSAFLLAARARGVDVVSLLVAAGEDADQAAAAEVLARIDPVVPNLNLSSQEFKEKVQAHRSERRRRSHNQARQMKELHRSYQMMYQ
jgi:predicted ATP-grasp superfamily ATP-dependent carboligase